MDNDIKHVHVGQAIDKRRNELGLSKSELGRKIGVPQQHINRILERETMETSRLIKVSEALDFNFFSLFCPRQHHISAQVIQRKERNREPEGNNQASERADRKSELTDFTS